MDKDYAWTENLYRERAKTVYAMQWLLTNYKEMIDFLMGFGADFSMLIESNTFRMKHSLHLMKDSSGLGGQTKVNHGDYIVHEDGKFSIVTNEAFRAGWSPYNEV